MDKTIYYNNLYDYYKELFTDKQKDYFEAYYFNNLSLQEIADNYKVSRNAIHNELKLVTKKLDYYEDKLKLYEKRKEIEKIIDNINNDIKDKILDII